MLVACGIRAINAGGIRVIDAGGIRAMDAGSRVMDAQWHKGHGC